MIMEQLPKHFDVLVIGKSRVHLDDYLWKRTAASYVVSWEWNLNRLLVMTSVPNIESYTTAYKTVLLNGTVDEDFETTCQSCCGMRLSSAYFCPGEYESDIHNYIQTRLRGIRHD